MSGPNERANSKAGSNLENAGSERDEIEVESTVQSEKCTSPARPESTASHMRGQRNHSPREGSRDDQGDGVGPTHSERKRDEIAAVLAEHWAAGMAPSGERRWECVCGEPLEMSDWLAERDRRTAATAVREAADEAPLLLLNIGAGVRESYIRTVDLRDRADRIERGE